MSTNETRDMNRDPITGAPGSHPVGTGIGAAVARAAGNQGRQRSEEAPIAVEELDDADGGCAGADEAKAETDSEEDAPPPRRRTRCETARGCPAGRR